MVASIGNAIETLYSDDVQRTLPLLNNPYDEGNATEKIMERLKFQAS